MITVREAYVGDGTLKVTTDGRVFSKRSHYKNDKSELEWHEICTKDAKRPRYKAAWVHYKDGTKEIKKVHQLIADAFLPNPFPDILTEINHIDGNKNNNRLDNLEWTTRLDNVREAYRIGLCSRKKIHSCANCGKNYYYTYPRRDPLYLCEDCKAEFRNEFRRRAPQEVQTWLREEVKKTNVSQADIAKSTGLDESTISYWVNGKRNLRAHNLEKIEKFLSESEDVCKPIHLVDERRTMRKKNEYGALMYRNYSRIRDEQGKTDYQVAKLTGFTTAFFSNWKNRGWQPRGDKIMAIAEKLNHPMGDFYEGVHDDNG